MGRRDLTAERTAQILAAFQVCLAREGLEGSTLERVAQQAGVKRSLIRHYIGNREDLIAAAAEAAARRARLLVDALIASLPRRNRLSVFLDGLFTEETDSDNEADRAFDLLIMAAENNPRCREHLSSFVRDFATLIQAELERSYRKRTPAEIQSVAWGLVGLCFSYEGLRPLALGDSFVENTRDAAGRLVESLRQSKR